MLTKKHPSVKPANQLELRVVLDNFYIFTGITLGKWVFNTDHYSMKL